MPRKAKHYSDPFSEHMHEMWRKHQETYRKRHPKRWAKICERSREKHKKEKRGNVKNGAEPK